MVEAFFLLLVCIKPGSSPMLNNDISNILSKYFCRSHCVTRIWTKIFTIFNQTYYWFCFYFSSAFSSILFSNNISKQCADSLVKVINAIDWMTGVWIYYIKATVLNCSMYFVYLSFVFCILFIYFDTSTVTIIGNISVFRVFLSKHSQWFSVIHFREIERFSQSKFKCTFSK